MKKSLLTILITLLICMFTFTGIAQGGFVVKFNSPTNEGEGNFLENSNHEYIGIVSRYNPQTDIYDHFLKKISSSGDTLLSKKFSKPDTTSFFTEIIQSDDYPIKYLISGYGNAKNKPDTTIDFFIQVDSVFNIMWERKYILCPSDITPYFENQQRLLKKKDSGFVFSTLYDNAGNDRLIFFEMAENGDSLNYRVYDGDSAGWGLNDLYYNYDSSTYIVNVFHSHYVPYWGETQVISIDFNFNQTGVTYLPRWHGAITSRILPDCSVVSGGIYDGFVLNPYQHLIQICALKYDTSLKLTDSCYFTNPDDEIGKREGYYNSIDYYYPNSIFVGGTYDYDVGIWITHPSWIALAKMDDNLNILSEQYIGGDAYYFLLDVVATSDGGVLLSTSRYDYQTQDYEHDLYVFKLDSIDLLVGTYKHKNNDLVKNAIVYPNPVREKVYVRTAVKDANFCLYDINGKIIKEVHLNEQGLITTVNLYAIPNGNYIWTVIHQNDLIETGKLMINK